MGMFDEIKYEAPCWKCGELLIDFQSKDGECCGRKITPKSLGVGSFYSLCRKCQAWNEYDVISKEVEIVLNEKKSKLETD